MLFSTTQLDEARDIHASPLHRSHPIPITSPEVREESPLHLISTALYYSVDETRKNWKYDATHTTSDVPPSLIGTYQLEPQHILQRLKTAERLLSHGCRLHNPLDPHHVQLLWSVVHEVCDHWNFGNQCQRIVVHISFIDSPLQYPSAPPTCGHVVVESLLLSSGTGLLMC